MIIQMGVANFALTLGLTTDTQQKDIFPAFSTDPDQCRFIAASAGLGDFVLASIPVGFFHPSIVGVIDGLTYVYSATNDGEWEEGHGTWHTGTGTLERFFVTESSNSDNPVNFSLPPTVTIVIAVNYYGNALFASAGEATAGVATNKYMSPYLVALAIGGVPAPPASPDQWYVTTADFTKSSSTALAAVTGLSATLTAGKTYVFEATLFLDSTGNASSNFKVDMSGTATATSVRYSGEYVDTNSQDPYGQGGVLGTVISNSSTDEISTLIIKGSIVVNAGGTLIVRFAQQSSSSTPSKVKAGSYLHVTQTN